MKLILTQEMKTSIEILEISSVKLKEFIEKEKNTNPAIEVVYNKNYTKNICSDSSFSPLDTYTEEKTLIDFLEEQLSYLTLDKNTVEICTFIINNLNEKGYLAIPKDEIINILDITPHEFKKSFDIIRSFEPSGVGAINLRDSLKLQLSHKNNFDENLYHIIDYHLEDLATQNFIRITRDMKISLDEVKNYLKEIQKLTPIPSRGYKTNSRTNYIIPDADVEIQNKKLIFKINEELLPKVYVKNSYKVNTPEDKKNIDRAINIGKCIQKRFDTLSKILEFLINHQKLYFFKGKEYLNTLTIKKLARHLGLHESTISRAIKDKYLTSPQGIIPIRSLFVLNSETFKIKSLIEELIEYENKEKPLSDMMISKFLKLKNYDVARRTVTKYREELGYHSSLKRKRKRLK